MGESYFDKQALEKTGQDIATLVAAYHRKHQPVTAQQIASHISQLLGEVYSPECARYACARQGLALVQDTAQALRARQRGRHQRIIADHLGSSFAWAIYRLTRDLGRHEIPTLARRLAVEHSMNAHQAKGLEWCISDACAIEQWLTIGGHFAGPARAAHKRDIETQRATCALQDTQVVGFQARAPGILCLFADGGGLTLRRDDQDQLYMRLETQESMDWYRNPQEDDHV